MEQNETMSKCSAKKLFQATIIRLLYKKKIKTGETTHLYASIIPR